MAAQNYGRQGIAVGGKGGRGLSSHYEFGVKAAREYLGDEYKGGEVLGKEYDSASKTLRADLPGGADPANLGVLQAKKAARGKVKKLRDIAQANAVSDFLGFASGKGRSSQARASKGLISGEQYRPDDTTGFESVASQNYLGSKHGGVSSKFGKAMAATLGANAWTMREKVLGEARSEKFSGTGPVDYREAALGATGHLHRQLADEDKYVKANRRVEPQASATPVGNRLNAVGGAGATRGPGGSTTGLFAAQARQRTKTKPAWRRGGAYGARGGYDYGIPNASVVEQERQSILNMTPGERYLHGITS